MKLQRHLFTALLLLATNGLADEPRLIALDGSLGAGVPAVIERFAGDDATIPAIILRAAETSPEITADVYLDGGKLAAPVTRGIVFQADAAPTHPALIEGKFVLASPDTDKSVMQLVRIHAKHDGNHAALPIASFRLSWVSPTECRARLALALASHEREKEKRLLLAGPLPGLRELLREWHISYDDAGRDVPVRLASGTLAVGDSLPEGSALPELAGNARFLLVRVRPVAATEIWRKDVDSTRFTQVDLPSVLDWRRSPLLIRLLSDHLFTVIP